MYAVIKTGGKQYRVSPGDVLRVERIKGAKKGDEISIRDVLLLREGENTIVNPEGVAVKAVVEGEEKGKKIIVFTYKRRKNYMRKLGHRQIYTKLRITSIEKEE